MKTLSRLLYGVITSTVLMGGVLLIGWLLTLSPFINHYLSSFLGNGEAIGNPNWVELAITYVGMITIFFFLTFIDEELAIKKGGK